MKEVSRTVFDAFIEAVEKSERVYIDELSSSLFLYKLQDGFIIGIDSPYKFEVSEKVFERYTGTKL